MTLMFIMNTICVYVNLVSLPRMQNLVKEFCASRNYRRSSKRLSGLSRNILESFVNYVHRKKKRKVSETKGLSFEVGIFITRDYTNFSLDQLW